MGRAQTGHILVLLLRITIMFNGSCAQTGHILVILILNLRIVSTECMMPTKSRIGVIILARIQWVRLLFACKNFLENYGYVFQSAVQNSLYQHARWIHLGR